MNSQTSEIVITYQKVGELRSNPRNSRTHSKRQIRQIADSIKAFGFVNPVLLDRNNMIIAGHGRVRAAQLLGLAEVPTIRLQNLSADQVRAYVIADNRLAEKAGWDKSILAIELQNLLTIDSDFDVTITGFEIPEIDLILTPDHSKSDPDDDVETTKIGEAVTRPGDLWQLGRHRLFCGSAIEPASFSSLLGSRRADVVFVDPPYNVAMHPTVKPVGLVADALLDCSARGDVVLDAFGGSGSTLIAAERVGRVCYGMEIDPLYVDVAIRRWQKHTGDHAIHAASGKLFDEIAAPAQVNHA